MPEDQQAGLRPTPPLTDERLRRIESVADGNDVLALVAEVRRLRARVKELEERSEY